MTEQRTVQDFLKELEDQNVSVTQWCREHKFGSSTVWAVIRGTVMGRSGEARRVLQAMRLPLPSARRKLPGTAPQRDRFGQRLDAKPFVASRTQKGAAA